MHVHCTKIGRGDAFSSLLQGGEESIYVRLKKSEDREKNTLVREFGLHFKVFDLYRWSIPR